MAKIQITNSDEALSYLTSCLLNQTIEYREKLGEGSPIFVKHAKIAEQGAKLMRGLSIHARQEDETLKDLIDSQKDIFDWLSARIVSH